MRRRIGIFLCSSPYFGGTFQYNQTILEALKSFPQDKFEIVIGYTSVLWLNYLKEWNVSKIHVSLGFWSRVLWKIWVFLKLPVKWWRSVNPFFHPVAKSLIGLNCDLWIFPSQDHWGFQINVPALIAIHDLMHRYERKFPEVSAKGEYHWREYLYSHICLFAKGILVDSVVGKNHVIESYGIEPERIFVLPFIPPKYIFEKGNIQAIDSKHQLPEKFIFYPAQFWEHKNHIRLIKAIALLKERLPDLNLVLVGSKKNGYFIAHELVKTLKLGKKVHFLGYVSDSDLADIYHRAKAMIMPTFFGPTNIPPLEGFAAGCPVAVSNIYGMPEQVEDAAILFNPNSVKEIAETIYQLWTDDELCKTLIKRGFEKTIEWGQQQFNNRLLEIIDNILV